MENATTNEKLIERVRKLYAMAQDTSSEHEAAIAARRARHLMDKHGLSVEDLQQSEFGSAQTSWNRKTLPMWYQGLVLSVAELNDCMVERSRDNRVTLKGFEVDVIGANLMLDYLIGAMRRQIRAWRKETGNKGTAAGNAYKLGFSDDMRKRIKVIIEERKKENAQNESTGTALISVKMKMVEAEFGRTRTSARRARHSSTAGYMAGTAASQKTSLNAQVSTPKQAALQ